MVPSDRPGGSGHALKHGRFPLNIGKHFFTVKVTDYWHGLSTEVIEALSLEILKSHLDVVLCNQVALLGKGSWTRWAPKVPANLNSSLFLSQAGNELTPTPREMNGFLHRRPIKLILRMNLIRLGDVMAGNLFC